MIRFSLCIVIFFEVLSFGWGAGKQEPAPAEAEPAAGTAAPFPLGPLLIAARQKTLLWRPDWDAALPPDGFRVSAGNAVSIELTLHDQTYRVRRNTDGSIAEFPFQLAGRFVQVSIAYRPSGAVKTLVITGADETGQVDFISDTLVRITQGDTVCFGAFRYEAAGIAETWYDPEGTALADFTARFFDVAGEPRLVSLTNRYEGKEETYFYDSFGNISEIQTAAGVYSALYAGEQQPRYWTQGAEQHILQWDAQGFPVRMSPSEGGASKYEYTLDPRGNWTERREIRMVPNRGTLVPSPGLTVKRVITYL